MPNLSGPAIKRFIGCLVGALLTAGLGWACLQKEFGQRLVNLSYDLPFLWRRALQTPNIVIVYLDTASRSKYQLPSGLLDRRKHVDLLQRLTRDRARMVFYDIVFRDENAEVDQAFATAIREHGNVVLGSFNMHSSPEGSGGVRSVRSELVRPNRMLREAAHHQGLLEVAKPINNAVRQLFTGHEEQESAVWNAARALGANLNADRRVEERWLNFYDSYPAFPSRSFAAALTDHDVPAEFFRDKVVVIGLHPDDLVTTTGREKFATPWTHFGGTMTPAVEILATSLGNLIQGIWLRRIPIGTQVCVIIAFGLLMGSGLSLLRPWTAAAAAVGTVALITSIAVYFQWHKHLWWSWMIPVAVQAPVALVWSIGYQYAVTSRREGQIRKALSTYLPPHLAKRIAASDFELGLGGKEVEATILFTDLEGFTPMAENLPPAQVSEILVTYFNRITTHILDHEGAIIKYVGDSVMAVWGALLPDARQAERAVLAARGIAEASRQPFGGRHLRTRIGINSGKALAGNLGSFFRFDYTVIGATTNLAARLEALNKPLGTDILISAATRAQLPETVPTRYLGQFILRGTSQPTAIYEVPLAAPPTQPIFEKALHACQSGDLTSAKTLFEQIAKQDRPAAFYLNRLNTLQAVPKPFVLELS